MNARSDLYSLGVVAGELLTGQRLQNPYQVDAALADALPAFLIQSGDLQLAKLLKGLLPHDPDKRPPGVLDVLRHPLLSGARVQLQCEVCLELAPADQGVECAGGPREDERKEPAPAQTQAQAQRRRHFCCDGCFDKHVSAKSQEALALLRRRRGRIPCVAQGQGHQR